MSRWFLWSHNLNVYQMFISGPECSEASTGGGLLKKLFIKVSQYLQENTLLKLDYQHRCFPMNIVKLSRRFILKDIYKQLLLFGCYIKGTLTFCLSRVFIPHSCWRILKQLLKCHFSLWKVFRKISKNFQENTCAGVSVTVKLNASNLQLYWKRDSGAGAFLWIFLRSPILQNFCERLFLKIDALKILWTHPRAMQQHCQILVKLQAVTWKAAFCYTAIRV